MEETLKILAEWVEQASQYRYDVFGPSFQVSHNGDKWSVKLCEGANATGKASGDTINEAATKAAKLILKERCWCERGFKASVRSMIVLLRVRKDWP